MFDRALSALPALALVVACGSSSSAPDTTPTAGASGAAGAQGVVGTGHGGAPNTTASAGTTSNAGQGTQAGMGGAPQTGGGAPNMGGTAGKSNGTAGMGGTAGTNSSAAGTSGAAGTSSGSAGMGGTAGTSNGTAGMSGAAGTGSGVSYTTQFPLVESPISESGHWHHMGLDWTNVDTSGGVALGTQALGATRAGPGRYNDSYAYLSAFPADQQASAVVHMGTIDPGCTHEVEILLRWADSAHNARGYECNVAWDGSYAEIVRWNGPVGDFTYLGATGSVPGGIHDGDTLKATIVKDKIELYVNGVMRTSAQDSTFATGDPGIGFWRGTNGCGTRGDFGFKQFSAASIPP
jgi:hypothetical protein